MPVGLPFSFGYNSSAALSWQSLKLGAGGFTRDLDIAPDGTKVCRIDVYGAYIWNPSVPSTGNAGGTGIWQQLCAPGRIPSGDPAYTIRRTTSNHYYSSGGAWAVNLAPSNSSVIYMVWFGMMYKSTNKGVTFVNQTDNAGGTFPLRDGQADGNPNGNESGPGPVMAIDPINANVCWVGDKTKVLSTSDGGTTWTALSTSKLPLPTGSYTYGFAFDPASAQTGGKTQGIFATVNGSGVYYSSDAGVNWTLQNSGAGITGTMPTIFSRIVCDKWGMAYVCDASANDTMYEFTKQSGLAFSANAWHLTGATAGTPIWSVAPDPASTSSATQRIITAGFNGFSVCQSTNGGTSWGDSQAGQFNQVATDIPWLQTNELYMTLGGGMKFDPSQSNKLYMPEGIGVWVGNPPTTGTTGVWSAWTWTSQSVGIESFDTNYLISPPGYGVGVVSWDRNWFSITDKTKFPTTYGTWPGSRLNNNVNQSVIWHGMGADWLGSDPSRIVLICGGNNGTTAGQQVGPGVSTNGGVPVTGWSFFTNAPPASVTGYGACSIAITSSTSLMAASQSKLWGTTDAGATAWVDRTPSGSAFQGDGGQKGVWLSADKVTANTYLAVDGTHAYRTSNTGVSWTTATPSFTLGNAGGGPQLKAIPNNAGHFFYSGGGSFAATVDTNNHFYRTSDGGATWSDVSQSGYVVRDVAVWGYGKAVSSYPTIFIYGYVNSVLGVWKSIDNCVSWTLVGDSEFGAQTFDYPNCMCGDMNQVGVVYIGFIGNGYLQYG